MGDFKEHVIFGFLTAAVAAYLLKGAINLSYMEAFASSIAIIVGSVLPDIDHKNAYVHRAAKAFVSMGAAIMTIIYAPFPIHVNFSIASMAFLVVYLGFSRIKMKHRGFTHSISFLLLVSSVGMTFSVQSITSIIPGIALGLGLLSHLILDQHVSLT